MEKFQKLTDGYVIQNFEKNKDGYFVCVNQQFAACNNSEYFVEPGEEQLKHIPDYDYHHFDMVQPKPKGK